jgi:hypothetical protein
MITVKREAIIELPGHLFECPICGDLVTVEAGEFTQEYDGTWKAYEISVNCVSEPDITEDSYEDWFEGHYREPRKWTPIDTKVMEYLEDNYRFEPPMDIFQKINKLAKELDAKARETGEVQTATISSDGWQPMPDAKGKFRFEEMTITIEPLKKKGK